MPLQLTPEQVGDLCDRLIGTPDEILATLEHMGLDADFYDVADVESLIADENLERCSDCDWWCEAGELVDEDGDECACPSCRTGEDDGE